MKQQPLPTLPSVKPDLYCLRKDRVLPDHQHWVYFYRAGDYVKVGTTNDVEQRGRDLQTGSPIQLILIGKVAGNAEYEADLHRAFRLFHFRGEWYRADEQLLNFIGLLTQREEEDRSDLDVLQASAKERRLFYEGMRDRQGEMLKPAVDALMQLIDCHGRVDNYVINHSDAYDLANIELCNCWKSLREAHIAISRAMALNIVQYEDLSLDSEFGPEWTPREH